MRVITQQELDQYLALIESRKDRLPTEEEVEMFKTFLMRRCCISDPNDTKLLEACEIFKNKVGGMYCYGNDERSECSVGFDDELSSYALEEFEGLYEEGDYIFYWSHREGLADRYGWVLTDKNGFYKETHWELMS